MQLKGAAVQLSKWKRLQWLSKFVSRLFNRAPVYHCLSVTFHWYKYGRLTTTDLLEKCDVFTMYITAQSKTVW